jgi:nucleotide-binding universal stress UspA family protein
VAVLAPRGVNEVVCVVVPPDTGEGVVAFAGALAERLGLPLALVEVRVPVPPVAGVPLGAPQPMAPPMDLPDLVDPPADDGIAAPGSDLARLADRAGVRPSRTETVLATPVDGIAETAGARGVELVVAADQGGGVLRSLLGASPARAGMRSAERPLVLVPRDASTRLPDAPAIVVAVDDDGAAGGVVALAAELARRLEGTLRLVRVVGRGDDRAGAAEQLERLRGDLPARRDVGIEVVPGDGGETLAAVAGDGLVVTGRPRSGALRAALSGSAVRDLLDAGRAPVVVAPVEG